MKSVFLGTGITICGLLLAVIIMTMSGRSTRSNELRNAVEVAMTETLENSYYQEAYTVVDNEEFIADFLETLLIQIESDGTIEVKILDVDAARGLLSVEVIEHYKHLIGTDGSVRVQETILMEQYMPE